MQKMTFANRLSLRIMAVLIVIFTIIMTVVYLITKDSMAHESEARYESIILHTEDRVRTSVTDTGRGIPPERRAHVFDTFREMGYTQGSRFVFELPKK